LIVKGLDRKKKRCILIIESSDDLWRLRRFIRTGDIITTRTSRVIKERGEFSRPDKGERIRVTIKLYVEQVFLDNTLERLRVRGKVLEASDESVGKSGYHTFSITPGSTIYVEKEEWNDTDTKLIHVKEESKYLMIALDRREAGIGILRGGHLFLIATIDSGASGKAFGEVDISSYIAKVAEITIKHSENMRIVVAGPGNTKSILANIIRKSGKDVEVVEGFDLTGADGVRGLIKFQAFKRIASSSTAVKLQTLVEEAINRISNGDRRVAFSLENVREAAVLGAVDSCIVSDNVFRTASDEQLVVETLNIIEQKGATVYVADTSLEYGKQVSSFGGIIALLRYPFRAYGFNREMN
jgi:protein pelota